MVHRHQQRPGQAGAQRPETYSNAVARRLPPPAEVAEEVVAIRAQGVPYIPTLLLNDPLVHGRYRRLAQKGFTPKAPAWMEPLVAQVADDLAARLPDDEVVDFITAFSRPLPVWAISRVLGLPDEMGGDIKRWTDAGTAAIGAQLPPKKWPQVERDLLDYQRTMLAEYERCRTEPIPGLLTDLLQAAEGEDVPEAERISLPEVVAMTRELLLAGNEISLRMLASMVLFLDQSPRSGSGSATTRAGSTPSSRRRSASPRRRRRCSARRRPTPSLAGWPSRPARRSWSPSWRRTLSGPSGGTRSHSTPTGLTRDTSVSAPVFTRASGPSSCASRPGTRSGPWPSTSSGSRSRIERASLRPEHDRARA